MEHPDVDRLHPHTCPVSPLRHAPRCCDYPAHHSFRSFYQSKLRSSQLTACNCRRYSLELLLDTISRLADLLLDSLVSISRSVRSGVYDLFGLFHRERREDVGLDLQFVQFGRSQRRRREEVGDTALSVLIACFTHRDESSGLSRGVSYLSILANCSRWVGRSR